MSQVIIFRLYTVCETKATKCMYIHAYVPMHIAYVYVCMYVYAFTYGAAQM